MALRVLVVETNALIAQTLARFFEEREDEVWHAWKLEEAAALLNLIKPDLMLLDMHFPGDGWVDFLRYAHTEFPQLKTLVTTKQIDLQREILARQNGVNVFVRQPFTDRWMENALHRLGGEFVEGEKEVHAAATLPSVRVPLVTKITLPFFVLMLGMILAGAYLLRTAAGETVDQNASLSLEEAGRSSASWMASQEEGMLAFLRLAANLEGVPAALRKEDDKTLRFLAWPLAVNFNQELVVFMDAEGRDLLSMQRISENGEYRFTKDVTRYQELDIIQKISQQVIDRKGDKYAGLVKMPEGTFFSIAGPVFGPDGEMAGMVLVGRSLKGLVEGASGTSQGGVTFYSPAGEVLASGMEAIKSLPAISSSNVVEAEKNGREYIRGVALPGGLYQELIMAWKVRSGEALGMVGIARPTPPGTVLSLNIRVGLFLWVVVGISLAIFIGRYLAGLIGKPVKDLTKAAAQVSEGNLEVKVDTMGDDETAVLAHSFNAMVVGLQESFIFKDFLGRSVSPEVRRQLRRTLESDALNLEGQKAIVTVLTADIRGFSAYCEKAEPEQVFDFLNEYFECLVPVVAQYGGVVNRFDGDSLLAFFGLLPRIMSPRESAYNGCKAALEMLRALEGQRSRMDDCPGCPIVSGISVHTGLVVAGGVGVQGKLQYTIVGDTVNTARELEFLTRQLFKSTGIIISEDSCDALAGHRAEFLLSPLGEYPLKPQKQMMRVYRLGPGADWQRRDGKE